MSKQPDVPSGIIGLLIVIIIFLVGVFANLLGSSVPTDAMNTNTNTTIPLSGASLGSTSQLQGNPEANPQKAATMTPQQLNSSSGN